MLDLRFLSRKQTRYIFSRAPHIKQMSNIETYYRSGKNTTEESRRSEVISFYTRSMVLWKLSEKQSLTWFMELIHPYLLRSATSLVRLRKVNFVKLKAGTEWNYPFTLPGTIVLTEKFIDDACRAKNFQNQAEIEHIKTILVHELVHIYQKQEPFFFEKFYQEKFPFIKTNVSITPELKNKILTNPDGYDYQWIVNINGYGPMLPLLIIEANGDKKSVLVKLRKNTVNSYINDGMKMTNMVNVPEYMDMFSRDQEMNQLYHPHEISATMISEYIINDTIYNHSLTSTLYRDLMTLVNNSDLE